MDSAKKLVEDYSTKLRILGRVQIALRYIDDNITDYDIKNLRQLERYVNKLTEGKRHEK